MELLSLLRGLLRFRYLVLLVDLLLALESRLIGRRVTFDRVGEFAIDVAPGIHEQLSSKIRATATLGEIQRVIRLVMELRQAVIDLTN